MLREAASVDFANNWRAMRHRQIRDVASLVLSTTEVLGLSRHARSLWHAVDSAKAGHSKGTCRAHATVAPGCIAVVLQASHALLEPSANGFSNEP